MRCVTRLLAPSLMALCVLAPGPAPAQSMNIPLIVNRVTTDICGPLMRTGDMTAAIRTAQAQGYQPLEWSRTTIPGSDETPRRIVLDGSSHHIGLLTLSVGRRGLCVIDMAEAGVAQIVQAMAGHTDELGLTLSYDAGAHAPAAAVWTGEGRLAIAAQGLNSPGHALSFIWTRPPAP